ncbi:hypothetical protein Ccrd_010728, partial [Cynara cardunculus var. scolymus]
MELKILQQYILGGIIATWLGFALIYFLGVKKSKPADDNLDLHKQVNELVRIQPQNDGSPEVIIVGAGVAGAALAYSLGKDGRRILVIERDLGLQDRIVGELLQPDCVENIDAQKVFGYALFKEDKSTRLAYPLEKFTRDVSGRSFHNGRFVQRMREKAATVPNSLTIHVRTFSVRLEQGTVTSLIEEKGAVKGVRYKTKAGQDITANAPLTIVEIPSSFVALLLKNCEAPYPNHGHVILADPSPILCYRISSTEIRCLVDIPGKKIPSVGNGEMALYLKTKVAPQIPPELQGGFIAAVDEGKIKTMANRSMPAAPQPTPGAILLGDSFNMRHPLTGGGMTVALSDVVVVRDLLRPLDNLNDSIALCKYLDSFYTLRKPVASTINTLAGALYKVFSASPDQARTELRQACFDYLSLGGMCSSGPIALLSGLNPKPSSLVLHFFSVAIFGVGRLLLPYPSPRRTWLGARLIL